jgi:hypothetical protein
MQGVSSDGWKAESEDDVKKNATFSLTWSGLKVTHDNAEVNIGYNDLGDDKTAMIRVNNGKNDTFTVDQEGNVSMSGRIDAVGGTIGDWELGKYTGVDGSYLRSGKIGDPGSFHMYTAYHGNEATIAGHSDESWRLTIGNNFGVNDNGSLHCSDIKATGGLIGSLTLEDGNLYIDVNNITTSTSVGSIDRFGTSVGYDLNDISTVLISSDNGNIYVKYQENFNNEYTNVSLSSAPREFNVS